MDSIIASDPISAATQELNAGSPSAARDILDTAIEAGNVTDEFYKQFRGLTQQIDSAQEILQADQLTTQSVNLQNINKIVEQAESVDTAISVATKKVPFSNTSKNLDLKDNVFTELVKNGIDLAENGINSINSLIQGGLNNIPVDLLLNKVSGLTSNIKSFATDTLATVNNAIDTVNHSVDAVTSAAGEVFSDVSTVLNDTSQSAASNITSFIQGVNPIHAIKAISKFDSPLTDAQTNTAIKGQVVGVTSDLYDFAEGAINENTNQLVNLSNTLISASQENGITDGDGIRTAIDDVTADAISEQNVFTALNNSLDDKVSLNRVGNIFNGDSTGINISDRVFDGLLSLTSSDVAEKFSSIIGNIQSAIKQSLSYDLDEKSDPTQSLNTPEQTVEVVDVLTVSQSLYNVSFDDISQAVRRNQSLNQDTLNIVFNSSNHGELTSDLYVNAGNETYT